MIDLGTVNPGSLALIEFDSFAAAGESITLTGLAVTDVEVYKDGGTTQRASDAGYTLLDTDGIDFDGLTGIHGLSIDLADNTTAGFWSAGSQYRVVISSVTIDSKVVSFTAARFRIGYSAAILNTTIATLASQTSFTLTSGPAEDDALNGCMVLIHDVASAVQKGFAVVQDYTGATKTVTLSAATTFTAATTDNVSIFPPAAVGVDLLGLFMAALRSDAFPNSTAILALLNAGGGGYNNATSQTVNVTAIANGVITAAAIATGAIDADAIAADAVTEIQSGLATAANLATVAGYIDTEIATLQTSIDAVPTNAELATAFGTADDAILAAIAALNNLSAAQINAEVLDVVNVDTYAEPGQGAPAATASLAAKIGYLYKFLRNKADQNATLQQLYADNGTTVDQKRSVAEASGTVTLGEVATGP